MRKLSYIQINWSRTTLRCLTILGILLLAVPLLARTVHGTVTDRAGKPAAGAAVRLKNSESLRIRSARTGPDGTYRFGGLDPRVDYELRASHQGRSSEWVRLSRFSEGEERRVDLQLR